MYVRIKLLFPNYLHISRLTHIFSVRFWLIVVAVVVIVIIIIIILNLRGTFNKKDN
jgi:hypothetical protein